MTGSVNPLHAHALGVPPPLETEEAAINWMTDLIQTTMDARDNVFAVNLQASVSVAGGGVDWESKSLAIYYTRHGSALGALAGLFATGRISEVAWTTLRRKVIETLLRDGESAMTDVVLSEFPTRLKSQDEAIGWLERLAKAAMESRAEINVIIPGNEEATVRWQIQHAAIYYCRHGSALGSLTASFRTGFIDPIGYNKVRDMVIQTLAASVVGRSKPHEIH